MKKLVYLTIYAAIYAQTGALGIANNAQPSTGLVAREIQIHAPNSPEQTVTVWVPATAGAPASESATRGNGTAKVINLPAGNSPESSVTIWVAEKHQNANFNLAARK
jgi:hypothetical protein